MKLTTMIPEDSRNVYFAHSMLDYNVEIELKALEALYKYFQSNTKGGYKVICPNNHLGELGSMQAYLDFLKHNCRKGVVVLPWNNEGYIGRGTYQEVVEAASNGIPIYYMNRYNFEITPLIISELQLENPTDWKYFYARYIE